MPKSANDFLSEPRRYIVVIAAPYGAGKTDAMMTFPAVYPATFDPAALEFLKSTDRGRLLARNLAAYPQDFSAITDPEKLLNRRDGLLPKYLKECEELLKAGSVKTIGIDGLTYLDEIVLEWFQGKPEYDTAKGERDTIRMNGDIARWWSRFILAEVMPLSSRFHANVVLTCHLKRESETVVEGGMFMKQKVKGKVQKDSDLAPLLRGKFKDTLGGMPGAFIILDHRAGSVKKRDAEGRVIEKDGKPVMEDGIERVAYCDKVKGLDTVVPGKNRYNLPAKLRIDGRNFYDLLLKYSGYTPQAAEGNDALRIVV